MSGTIAEPFESIYNGFWLRASKYIEKSTPRDHKRSYLFAVLTLTTALMDYLLLLPESTVEETENKAAAVLAAILQINNCKRFSMVIRYNQSRYVPLPSKLKLLEWLRILSLHAMVHKRNSDPGFEEEYYCEPELNKPVEKILEKIMSFLHTKTNRSLRDLAKIYCKKVDAETYAEEAEAGIGLEFLPIEYL